MRVSKIQNDDDLFFHLVSSQEIVAVVATKLFVASGKTKNAQKDSSAFHIYIKFVSITSSRKID